MKDLEKIEILISVSVISTCSAVRNFIRNHIYMIKL